MAEHVEQGRGDAQGLEWHATDGGTEQRRRQAQQDDACVLDGAEGEETLEVVLGEGVERASHGG